jgi:hypothetical protein
MSPSTLFETKTKTATELPSPEVKPLPPWLAEPDAGEPEVGEPLEEAGSDAAASPPEPIRIAIGFLTIVVLGVAAFAYLFQSPI